MSPSFQPNPGPDPDKEEGEIAPRVSQERYAGELFPWFETGTEGLVWSLQQDGKEGYDGLVPLRQGDQLTVTAPDGSTLFDGVLECDRKTGWTPRWKGASHGQPVAQGYWVHWTQAGWSPDDWAEIFICRKNRGVVVRNPQERQPL